MYVPKLPDAENPDQTAAIALSGPLQRSLASPPSSREGPFDMKEHNLDHHLPPPPLRIGPEEKARTQRRREVKKGKAREPWIGDGQRQVVVEEKRR